ncbi:hypothetical protein TUM19329_02760 [Legionella antarctica]|uniref:Uncharacterized protein n=1 Tax=Legionella antarctica TaxID=2708020 RepID=A0A6F8SZU1_9GAMM|nr:hypothetical protein [Legionella antarctica]BCA93915.1 hypothetical protein TUM19329_02760 [Legionella antarctica]
MAIRSKSADSQQKLKQQKINSSIVQTSCLASAAMAIDHLHGRGRLLDAPTVMDQLATSANKVNDGNLKEVEQMLMTQAKTLDYIFYDALKQLADVNMINQIEVFSNIAFRAQSQCRKTLATLAELKHPRRATFVKQQNNAINQQVNNGIESESGNFKKNKKFANELISEVTNEKVDIGGAISAGTIDSSSETVDVLNRPKDTRR